MKIFSKRWSMAFCLLSFAIGALSGFGCVEQRPLAEKTASFRVDVEGVDPGSPNDPLPFLIGPLEIDVTVTALSNKGGVMRLNGPVSLRVQPGRILGLAPGTPTVELADGVGQARVTIDRVYGSTHVCAEDDLSQSASYAMGCSDRFHFEMPRIAQVQHCPRTVDSAESPMDGAFIDIASGDLVVTGVFPEGFFLTDVAAEPVPNRPGDFGSIFVFSFSYPDGISLGDRLSSVSGTVQVFIGSTQLVFPAWVHHADTPAGQDEMPEPVEITADICDAATSGTTAGLCGHRTTNMDIESLESALVSIHGARTPTRWVDCDFNRDGEVANFDPECNQTPIDPALETHCAEIACKNDCNQDKSCSELSSYQMYGQWSVALDGGSGPKINVVTRDGMPEFDPLAEENRGILIDVTGNLRHSLPARPRWLILARNADDVRVHRPN